MRRPSAHIGLVVLLAGIHACGGASTGVGGTAPVVVTPPQVVAQPIGVSVSVGQPATFTVQATGTGPLAWQWYRNAQPVAGATTATFTIASAQRSDSGAVFYATVTNAGGTTQSATATLTVTSPVTVPANRALTVLFPPSNPGQPYYADVQTYLMNNPAAPVSGASIAVSWSAVDKGPGANPQYDWTVVDNAITPWINAGKKVYLTVWGSGYGTGTASLAPTPAWVQSLVSIINCTGSSPAFWQSGYYLNYQAFMAALVQRYGSSPSIGYIRFGLGIGGETTVVNGFSSAACQTQLTAAGYSTQVWLAYIGRMLDFEQSLHAARQLMVAVDVPNSNNPDYSIPDSIAAHAVRVGIGFGSEGLQESDITNYNAGRHCGVDWCALFNQYAGQVPLELQTLFASDPTGAGVGSLADLLPFAAQRHATSFEIYWADWLIAFDPAYPQYAQYHVAYQQAIQAALTPPPAAATSTNEPIHIGGERPRPHRRR